MPEHLLDMETRIRLETRVLYSVRATVNKANALWPSLNLSMPEVDFDKQGTFTHATAYCRQDRLSFNRYFLLLDPEDMITQTAPHEVAHLVAFKLFGREGRGHGPAWQRVMVRLGLEPNRCATTSLNEYLRDRPEDRPANTHIYVCGCEGKISLYSNRKHNNVVMRGMVYTCGICHQPKHEKGSSPTAVVQAAAILAPMHSYAYRCGCKTHMLSKRAHNNIVLRGRGYTCCSCRKPLVKA